MIRKPEASRRRAYKKSGRLSYALVAAFAALSILPLAACGPGGDSRPQISLDEAKRVAAEFKSTDFHPPPRKVNDILELLERAKAESVESLARQKALADSAPPPGLAQRELARFYASRAFTADKLGRSQQMINDLQMAAEVSAKAGNMDRIEKTWMRWDHAEALLYAGNTAEARARFEEILKGVRFNPTPQSNYEGELQGHSVAWYGELANAYGMLGDFEALEKAMRRVSTLNTASAQWPMDRQGRDIFSYFNARSHAAVLDLQGRYGEAEVYHRQAIRAMAGSEDWSPPPGVTAEQLISLKQTSRAQLAVNLGRQMRLLEAENEARIALQGALKNHGLYSFLTITIVQAMNDILFTQGRFHEAENLARVNLDTLATMGVSKTSLFFIKARVQLANTLAAQGLWDDALKEFKGIKTDLGDSPDVFERTAAGNVNWGLALLNSGKAAEARDIISRAAERIVELYGESHFASAEVRGFLAMVNAAEGNRAEALAGFAAAMPVLISSPDLGAGESTDVAARTMRLRMIIEAYLSLLATSGHDLGIADPASEAFRIAEAARSVNVQQALSASAARSAVHDPNLADLIRQEQDVSKQRDSLYAILNSVQNMPAQQQDPKALEGLRRKIEQLDSARVALLKEIQKRFPDYAALVNPKPATVEEARAALRPGEALIATFVGRERTYVWAIPRTGSVAFAATAVGGEDLSDTVAILRSALEPNAATLGDIPEFDLAAAHDLYQQLLEPVKAGWKDADSLLVVAHGPLGYLPLSVLPTGAAAVDPTRPPLFSGYREVPWLARTHSITVLPSVASLKALRGLPPADSRRKPYVGFGDPWFSAEQAAAARMAPEAAPPTELAGRGALAVRGLPVRLRAAAATTQLDSAELARLPRLPDTAEEIRGTASALNADLTADVFLGARANEQLVKTMDLSVYEVVAFATHGLVPGDLNGLTQPALALSAPEVAGVEGDGLLTMGEILGLELDADWVVLSACNTGSGEGAGAEAVSGLGRAFFYAGTRALLVSNWPVETTSTKTLTTDLFRRQAEDPSLTRAQALRQAMLALIDGPGYVDPKTGSSIFSYAHPIFWAPFSLIGDGSGSGARPQS